MAGGGKEVFREGAIETPIDTTAQLYAHVVGKKFFARERLKPINPDKACSLMDMSWEREFSRGSDCIGCGGFSFGSMGESGA